MGSAALLAQAAGVSSELGHLAGHTSIGAVIGVSCLVISATFAWVAFRTRRELALGAHDTEQRYRNLVDHAPDAIFIHCSGTIVYANAAAAVLLGADSSEALVGLDAFARVHPDWRALMRTRAATVNETGGTVPLLEAQMLRLDGTVVTAETLAASVDYCCPGAVQVVLRDMTGRRSTEAAQRESAALVQLCVKHAPAAVAMVDCNMRYLAASDRWLSDYSLGSESILGRTHYELFPELAEERRAIHQRALAGEAQRSDETAYIRADGRTEWVRWEIVPWYAAAGTVGGLIMLTEFITARKELELAVLDNEARFRRVLETVRAPAVWLDVNGVVTFVNDELLTVLEWSRDDLLGADWFATCSAGGDVARQTFFAMLAGGNFPPHVESQVLTRTGQRRIVAWDSTLRHDMAGKLLGSSSIGRDVTQQRAVEEAGRAARDAAEAATRAKSEFVANMSHEIRTPMNGVVGMLELALGGPLAPEQREYLEIARESAGSLLSILNDILDFSKIEAGRLELAMAPFELRDVIGDALRSFAVPADQKVLELIASVSPNVPATIIGDVTRLRQVIVNLVSNAIKFTHSGEVVVTVEMEPSATHLPASGAVADEEQVLLRIGVRDTGIGIEPEKCDHIFGAFQQADSSTTREFGGTGLGLAICSQLVAMMGGRLWVESEIGQGSTFYFTAAVTRSQRSVPAAGAGAPVPTPLPSDTRILVIDDNATSRNTLSSMLAAWGVDAAATGPVDAVQLVQRAQDEGRPFDLVLLDTRMPDIDGFAIYERIRQHVNSGCGVVMMLSASRQQREAARCRALGVRACLPKPIYEPNLLRAIQGALGHPVRDGALLADDPDGRGVQPAAAAAAVYPLRVLLVDDNPVNRLLGVALLERRGHVVLAADNGQEALRLLEADKFDVVLMDVHMPVLGGFETTAAIRAREGATGEHLPIVAMTASAMLGDRERCLAAGMDGYIAKPICPAELFEMVERLAGPHETASFIPHAMDRRAERRRETDPVDLDALRRVTGDDAKLMHDLLVVFHEGLPSLRAAAHHAADESDLRALGSAAHALKGSAGSIGAKPLFQAALAVELLAHDHRAADIDAAMRDLDHALGALEITLRSGDLLATLILEQTTGQYTV